MEIRFANDINWVKNNSRAISPREFEIRIIDLCKEINYEFLGFYGEWKGIKTKLVLKCNEGHVYNTATIDGFIGSGRRCPECKKINLAKKKIRAISPEEYTSRLNTVCLEDGYTFIGFYGEWKGNETKVIMQCPHGHEYNTTTINSFLGGVRCPHCKRDMLIARNTISVEEYNENIENVCSSIGYVYHGIIGEWNGYNTKIALTCSAGHSFKTASIRSFLYNGSRCPCCANYGYNVAKAGYLYVQRVTGEVDAIKFGITNRKPEQRMRQHINRSKLNHELVFFMKFEDGQKALDVETRIKQIWKEKTGYVSRELMEDGFTETLPAEIMNGFLKDVKSLCNLAKMNISLA
ncbi:hypothetical protein HXQ92_003685 [Salmonella enterica]|nr:hypothetical protein [Salmonella enterica]EDU7817647.1 hypothetical protein [Salmonella enterica subsp. enterica serovar Norwich]EBF3000994.1 hypothetical protein [Salmonella enterica]EBH7947409.1 hypothetical protein [Salmonella enterica]ECD9713761.1 hypothetical protein [Salmonella enterica]